MRGVSLVAIVLVAMLITPVQGTPIVDEVNMMQGGGNDDRQPSANNTTYWLFGSEAMDRGHGHFFFDENNSEQGSSPKGYGYKTASNGRISIDISFRMDPMLAKDMVLELDKVIRGTFYMESYGLTGSDCTGGNACKEFTVTFKKAGLPVASDTFLTGGSGQETINWEFAVAENMTEWKKNQDNIEVQIEYEVQADNSAIGCGTVFDCSAEIFFFYTHPDQNRDNSVTDCDGCNSNVVFPILEIDTPLPGVGEDGEDGEEKDIYSQEYYMDLIPFTDSAKSATIDLIVESFYQLGLIYKEELRDFSEAINAFETLIEA